MEMAADMSVLLCDKTGLSKVPSSPPPPSHANEWPNVPVYSTNLVRQTFSGWFVGHKNAGSTKGTKLV